MEVLALIEVLEDVIEKGISIPLSGKCLIDKEEVLELIQEIRLKMPDDLKQAKWVKEERQRILLDAQKEAEKVLKGAETKIISMIDEHEVTKRAYEQANEIIANAQKNAREIKIGTREYADELLEKAQKALEQQLAIIHDSRNDLRG